MGDSIPLFIIIFLGTRKMCIIIKKWNSEPEENQMLNVALNL